MERVVITWSLENIVTIGLMSLIGGLAVGYVVKFAKGNG